MIRSIRVSRPLMVATLILLSTAAAALWGLELVTEREVVHLWAAGDLPDFEPLLNETTQSYRSPWGLAVDSSGTIYITDSSRGAVYLLDAEGAQPHRVQLANGIAPSFPSPVGEDLFVYDQHEDELIRISLGDLREKDDPDLTGRRPLVDLLGGFVADFTGVGLDERPGVQIFRLESAGDEDLFVFAELITDREIYRLAVCWPVGDPQPEQVQWRYLARITAEDGGTWTELLPGPEEESSLARDATGGGSLLRQAGGPLLWELEFPNGVPVAYETSFRVSPHLIGERPDGGLWLAERRPLQREGLSTTAFSSAWTLSLVTSAGEVVDSLQIPWPEDWRSGPTVTLNDGSLYVLYPANDGTVNLRMIRVEKRWRWRPGES